MMIEAMNETNTVIGHVLAPLDPDADANLLLGAADWENHFQSIAITREDWRAMMKEGIDEALRTCVSEGLVDEAEEAWFEPSALVNICTELAPSVSPEAQKMLNAIAELARDAFARGVPVILAM